ncbi:WD40-repeat-containing domain protein [Neohortaea acidophila]|uniref:Pre-mRNA-processing factor 17 n=1 Tax=Neohortaea acidophila TaxID=245834 RepID=A0A6A6Q3X8_9PEZI|nr:WD40-repeat-containing domain protein [Neohortaea acidophila]KAF2486694.1 WD40-repeat-containing domain protein [Neohortaea acidophila]
MSLVPARNGANAPPTRAAQLTQDIFKTSTKGKVPTGYAQEIAISEQSFRSLHRDVQSQQAAGKKRKREGKGDSGVTYGANAYKGPWARYEEQRIDSDSGEEVEMSGDESGDEVVVYEEDEIAPVPEKGGLKGTGYADISADKETSTFEGSQEFDYQGRTYMHVPQDLDVDLTSEFENLNLRCYHPKKLIHTFRQASSKAPGGSKDAHEKAITALKFFPSSGHLLLSAAADGKVKLWDVYHNRELLRSFSGHTKSVVDIDFTPDGTKFISASYDRQMKVWDTETGKCLGRYSTGSTPHVVRWQPEQRAGQEFLAGMHDNKIVQFDTRISSDKDAAGDKRNPVQEYDHHLGPVNSITFCDENRRFITTSDDKSLRAWEYNIPVPIKLISDPSMFALTSSATHPTKPCVLLQSSDNTIQVYNTGEKIKQNRKKDFRGHNNAGYAIDVDVSPDGGIVCSGDSAGWVCFWDWKTCKMWHKIRASEEGKAVVGVAWHPRESSKVVTGDVGGVVKYWD